MQFNIEERLSDSPFVERIWRNQSERDGAFTSIALSHWELVVATDRGKTTITLRGPETKATPAYCPPNTDFFGIIFKIGTVMPHLPASTLVDGNIDLPNARRNSFYLYGSAWQVPTYDNADTFVNQLVRHGLLIRESTVEAALQGQLTDLSLRSVQRRFLQVTGLTHNAVRQIERARYATTLLKQGVSILDTVELAGYADQPHLTRALKHLIGRTPAQITPESTAGQLSFLFKTIPFK